MLSDCSEIKPAPEQETHPDKEVYNAAIGKDEIMSDALRKPSELGLIHRKMNKHFYSKGAFNLIQLVLYVLKQTGPASIFLCTYSIAGDSIATLIRKKKEGSILGIRFLIDSRVRSISPKPFDYLITSFPDAYRCCALHAKVALIWNEEWHVSIVGSQNATHNPKLERGIIHTDPAIWNFDLKILKDEFERGSL
jgi:hypothetical protein